jgi:hypothetical protein
MDYNNRLIGLMCYCMSVLTMQILHFTTFQEKQLTESL